jgi:hypothetical protein
VTERVRTRLYRDPIKVLRPMKIHPQFHEVGIGMLNPQEGVGRVRLKVDKLGLAMVLAFLLMSILSVSFGVMEGTYCICQILQLIYSPKLPNLFPSEYYSLPNCPFPLQHPGSTPPIPRSTNQLVASISI